MTDAKDFIRHGKEAAQKEYEAVKDIIERIDNNFAHACELMMNCRGRVIVTGVGKSGHIAHKMAATLASTGTPSFFVHASEASHGDFGMITRDDVVVTISNSGSTSELMTLIPMFKRLGIAIISMSGKPTSPLAEFATVNLDVSVEEEACPLNLAPTSSTTATLVMADALAVALLEARGFSAEDFAFSHPGGALGRKLLLKVQDLMHAGDALPRCNSDAKLIEALAEMTEKGFGMTTVVGADDQLLGIFTDGDLRRAINNNVDLNTIAVSDVMTANPLTVHQGILAAEALLMMEQKKITALVVQGDDNDAVGVLHMHDLLRAGIY